MWAFYPIVPACAKQYGKRNLFSEGIGWAVLSIHFVIEIMLRVYGASLGASCIHQAAFNR
jgi:hypothetical protein